MATTASLPVFDRTDNLTLPRWMYITCVAGSPWAKMTAPLACLAMTRDAPADSRNAATSNSGTATGSDLRFGVEALAATIRICHAIIGDYHTTGCPMQHTSMCDRQQTTCPSASYARDRHLHNRRSAGRRRRKPLPCALFLC